MPANAAAAKAFHALHQGAAPLVLANCWDAGSARLIESLGAKAVATTSAGFAWSLGYPDGDAVPVGVLAKAVGAVARVVKVPVSVDMEGGYSKDPALVGNAAARVVDAGAVGINIEDGSDKPEALVAKIAAIRQSTAKLGVDLFINARTDVYLRGLAPPETRVETVLARARQYIAAGASGIFVPGLTDAAAIKQIASAVDRPLNVMASKGLPPLADLAKLGVKRLSAGAAMSMVLWAHAAQLAGAFLKEGRSDKVTEGAMAYGEINKLFQGL